MVELSQIDLMRKRGARNSRGVTSMHFFKREKDLMEVTFDKKG
jgi:predicted DNA-binding WGR domain protein